MKKGIILLAVLVATGAVSDTEIRDPHLRWQQSTSIVCYRGIVYIGEPVAIVTSGGLVISVADDTMGIVGDTIIINSVSMDSVWDATYGKQHRHSFPGWERWHWDRFGYPRKWGR